MLEDDDALSLVETGQDDGDGSGLKAGSQGTLVVFEEALGGRGSSTEREREDSVRRGSWNSGKNLMKTVKFQMT